MPSTYDFRLVRATTTRFVVHAVDSADKALDLSDYAAYARMTNLSNSYYNARDPFHSVTFNCYVNPLAKGQITVEVLPSMTHKMDPGTYTYAVEIVNKLNHNEIYTVLIGTVTLLDNPCYGIPETQVQPGTYNIASGNPQ